MMPLSTPRLLLLALVTSIVALPAPVPAQADRAVYDQSTSTDELFTRAREAFALTSYSVAEEYYEEILRRDRTNLQAILELSNVYQRTGKLEYARGLLIRATRIDPDYPAIVERRESVDRLLVGALSAEVDSLLHRGDYEAAIPKLSLHNAIDPGNPSVHYKRALCLLEMGRHDAALSDIDVAIAAVPQEPYFLLRDRINGELQRLEVKQIAGQAARLSRSENPRHREQALDLLGQILTLDPEHTWARNEFIRLGEATPEAEPDRSIAEEAIPSTFDNAFRAFVSAFVQVGSFLGRHLTMVVVLIVAVLVFRSPLTRSIAGRFARVPLLSGDLSRFSLAEVLTMLNAEPQTGVLDIRGKGGRGRIYFEAGEPCHCVEGKKQGVEALLSLLDRTDRGRFHFSHGAMPLLRTIDTPLSVLLVERAHKSNGVTVRPGVVSGRKSRMKELLDDKVQV